MRSVPRPYIGIVGVKNCTEAVAATGIIKNTLTGRTLAHQAQLGLQVTRTTLNGGMSSNSRRNPLIEDVPDMFGFAKCVWPDLFTVVHFTPKDPSTVAESVRKIFKLGDMYDKDICRGLQLNGQFGKITPETLEEVKKEFPELKIILQLHHEALERFEGRGLEIGLSAFERSTDYVLIDPSGGKGQEMDIQAGAKLARSILNNTKISVGLAGGLRGENVGRIVTELHKLIGTSNFSIDAEGGLRDKRGDGYGNDDLNLEKVEDYFRNAVNAFYPRT